ncbi:Pyridoxal phosphate homeostasis protein [Maioricimonas rarisocia]|uniref:Pyridoxal phosphate homeostasis protein n=1 Tax=Maioricimonas rarisocia TaxID=2528026 RepID=A0A517Z6M5_9PLAN|nr:YggS family pyridoxal phosphate-dependent enzyme [Maioricimonas rarisocia]QDU38146.1 Pyridoxal phosphate homeostasis protein [Maioricimonas rarisocia]
MSNLLSTLSANLAAVRDRIAAAADRSNRDPDEVVLVAVTKYAELDWVRGLIDLGVTQLGESRPQQLVSRSESLAGPVTWHLIGHLQRNKVRPVLPVATLIHSVDSFRLLDRIETIAEELGVAPRVLLEVNVTREESKNGFVPSDLLGHSDRLTGYRHLVVDGLMTMAPRVDDPELARPAFASLRQLRETLAAATGPNVPLGELSMGMSGDFEIAVEEGATLVRIGSGLFAGLASDEARP